jgi:signal transduction histidine kinase
LQIRELKARDGLRRERVANLSHDLRTSLTALHGYLETLQLKEGRLREAERREFLDTAVRHSEHLAWMVSDFFELAKLEYRDVMPRRERLSMKELAQDVVHKFQPAACTRGIRLYCEPGPGAHRVEADTGMMERVLTNLIDNALKFTPAGGSVSVRLRSDGEQVRVLVEDTGGGIDGEELSFLASESSSFLPPSRSRPDSSGLGLAIVKRILLLHGTRLAVESVVGRGSCFIFTLPLAASEPALLPVREK